MKYNGNDYILENEVVLSQFLKSHGYDFSKIAVEINFEIIPKTNYDKVILKSTDSIEVVSFVGGG